MILSPQMEIVRTMNNERKSGHEDQSYAEQQQYKTEEYDERIHRGKYAAERAKILKEQVTIAILILSLWLEVCAEILRGYPCIRRRNHLYCPSPGNTYPNSTEREEDRSRRERSNRDRIEKFIDENKALVKRMVGEYSFGSEDDNNNTPAFRFDQYETYDGYPVHSRNKRARSAFGGSPNKVDACESAVEIVTPYWASNSAGKIRAIVNTQHLQQAIQQEVCQAVQTKKCNGDCNCEQKYKWHRLLAYDPDDDCKGIFMDWFLFPSCCVCRCLSPIKQ